ncbi:hypothetical protein AAFN60_02575 [Roseibacillus persicicus]|uniref:hypothetical protein n=1 Tax=Roseibacillus persicicus TaxID=454148 RepID=UPI00398ABCE1
MDGVAQKDSKLAIALIFLPATLAGLFGLTFLIPGELKSNYRTRWGSCLCDPNGSYYHFRDGHVVAYNRHHQVAYLEGRFDESSKHSYRVYRQSHNVRDEENLAPIVKPRLLGCFIEYPESDSSEWCWNLKDEQEVNELIKKLEVHRYFRTEEGEERTYYDSDFKEVRTEFKPHKKRRQTP